MALWCGPSPNVLQQTGSPGPLISGKVIATPSNYIIPGSVGEPGTDNFIDTGDTRISGMLQYASGYINPNLNTGNGGISVWAPTPLASQPKTAIDNRYEVGPHFGGGLPRSVRVYAESPDHFRSGIR